MHFVEFLHGCRWSCCRATLLGHPGDGGGDRGVPPRRRSELLAGDQGLPCGHPPALLIVPVTLCGPALWPQVVGCSAVLSILAAVLSRWGHDDTPRVTAKGDNDTRRASYAASAQRDALSARLAHDLS